MAGIYIHIPFCKQACHYCDFHFSTSLKNIDELITALVQEIELKQNYLDNAPIETIYFGGGTPSLIPVKYLEKLMEQIFNVHKVNSTIEITLEANPDDLTKEKVKQLRQTPINRFSIGVQSFYDEDLKWMNRAHNGAEASDAIKRVQDAGFENITIDLIYGMPSLSDKNWDNNIKQTLTLAIPHISSYSLTVEPQTALAHFIQKGQQQPLDEEKSARQFKHLMNQLEEARFIQYEISNFCKQGFESKHNSSYWKGTSYIGIGPSAHSFNGKMREWNIKNNIKYIESLSRHIIPAENELLSINDEINEYIMISLRTIWGIDLTIIEKKFGDNYLTTLEQSAEEFIQRGWIEKKDGVIKTTREGKLFADKIAAQLFY